MASFRTTLTEGNMDVIMFLVRKFDKNPSEIINLILETPKIIEDARSEMNGKDYEKGWSKQP